MLKNKIIGIFLVFVAMQLSAMAIGSYYKNFLNKVELTKDSTGNYSANLVFNRAYTEPLKLQQKSGNLYSIILPETRKSEKTFNLIKGEGTENVKIQIVQYPYLDKTVENGYVKILLKTQGNMMLTATTPKKKVAKTPVIVKPKKETNVIQKVKTKKQAPIAEKIKETPVPLDPTAKTIEIEEEKINESTTIIKPKKQRSTSLFEILIPIALVLLVLLITINKLRKSLKRTNEEIKLQFKKPIDQTREEADLNFINGFEKSKQKENEINNISTTNEEMERKIKLINQAKEQEPKEKENSSPALLSNIKIEDNKGFYLVKAEEQIALIGYINDEIFIINRFKDLKGTNLQTRLNEKSEDKSRYIVKIDDYKALVEVSEDKMDLVVEL